MSYILLPRETLWESKEGWLAQNIAYEGQENQRLADLNPVSRPGLSELCIRIIDCFSGRCVYAVVSDSFRPTDHSLPGSSVGGIFMTRILEWVAVSSSRGSSSSRDWTHVSQFSCTGGQILIPLSPLKSNLLNTSWLLSWPDLNSDVCTQLAQDFYI